MESLEKKIHRLLDDHLLGRIEMRFVRESVIMTAYPHLVHKSVEERRTAAFRDREGESLSLTEVAKISEEAEGPVARSKDKTVDGALDALMRDLKRVEHA